MSTLQRLEQDTGFLVGSMMTLYNLQMKPGNREHWLYGSDVTIYGSFVSYYQKRGLLTVPQLDWLRRSLKKYAATLETLDVEILPFKAGSGAVPMQNTVKTAVARLDGRRIRVSFSYSEDLVRLCKTLNGYHYEPTGRTWDFPLCLENVDSLKAAGFSIDISLQSWYAEMTAPVKLDTVLDIPGLGGELRQFQKEGVAFINAKKGRALIGDDMGLGKSVQALAYLQQHKGLRPAIIVCPACVKINWEREAAKWTTEKVITVLRGRAEKKDFNAVKSELTGITIVNYDILANRTEKDEDGKRHPIKMTGWADWLKTLKPEIVIIDEIQAISSRTANRTKAVLSLCRNVPQVVGLSGTPIENRPIEFYTCIHLINPGVFPSFFSYALKYCGAKHNGFGWEYNGSSNVLELNDTLCATLMLRRKKADVLKELPPKTRSIVPMEIENVEEYEKARDGFLQWIDSRSPEDQSTGKVTEMAQLEVLKQIVIRGKLKAAIEWIDTFLQSGEKLVVFSVHRNTTFALMERFGAEAVKIIGGMTDKDRQASVDRFQTDDSVRLFCGNIQAAGSGITLTAACNTCFLELPWTPGKLVQAEDRIYRIGQSQPCNIWYLVGSNTIDEDMAMMLEAKAKVLGSILDGVPEEETSLIGDLIKKLKGEVK